MAYSSLGFDDVNRSLYNAALRILGLFWIFYFWVVFNLFSAQVCVWFGLCLVWFVSCLVCVLFGLCLVWFVSCLCSI